MSKNVSSGRPQARRLRTGFDASVDAASLYSASGARKYLNRDERARALHAIEDIAPDHALFALVLAWSGARVSEVLELTPSRFQLASGLVAIRTLKRRRHCMREVPLPPELMLALDQQFALRSAQATVGDAERRLWPWCRQTAWRLVKRIMKVAEVTGLPASPRGLRHGFGLGTLQAGVPLNLVQRWLGYARITTTSIYAAACGPEEVQFAAAFWRLDAGTVSARASAHGSSPVRPRG